MDRAVHAIGWFVERLLRPLDALAPWLSLAIIAAVTAVVMLLVIRKTSPQRRIRHARGQMAGAIFEMRLYLDHPVQLLRAQGRLIRWSVVYVGYLLPSMLVLAAPLGLLFVHLEARHGFAPLPVAEAAVVRIEVAPGVSTRDLSLDTGGGLAVTARVHAEDEHALYARIAVRTAGTHTLAIHAGDATVQIAIVADRDADVVSPERRHGISELWSLGAGDPIATDAIRAVTIPYPDRPTSVWMPWWLYWLGVATGFALVLRDRMGVAL